MKKNIFKTFALGTIIAMSMCVTALPISAYNTAPQKMYDEEDCDKIEAFGRELYKNPINGFIHDIMLSDLCVELSWYGEDYAYNDILHIINDLPAGKNFPHSIVQFLVNNYECFGQPKYVDGLRAHGFTDVDFTKGIMASLKHGEITQAEADRLLGTTTAATTNITTTTNGTYTVAAQSSVMYTVDGTDVYTDADVNTILLKDLQAGLPIEVTGITSNGYFQVVIAGATYYIPGAELTTIK